MENIIKEKISSNSLDTKWFALTDSEVKEMGHYLKDYLLNGTPIEKLRSLQILRNVSEYSSSMLRYISRRIIKYVFDWALFKGSTDSPDRGLTLFDSSDPTQQRASADFLIYFLDSIDFWGRISSPESNLRTAQEKIIDANIILFPPLISKKIISEKLAEIQLELKKLYKSIENDDYSIAKTILKNLDFYLRSIRILCEQDPGTDTYFKDEIVYYENLIKKVEEWIDFLSDNPQIEDEYNEQLIPKIPPRTDSPINFEMVTMDEDITFDQGEKEWKSIKEEFFRLREAEILNKLKISQQQENIIKKVHQITQVTYELNESKEELESIKKKFQKVVSEFQIYKDKVKAELDEKNALITVMVNNKNQMREVFLAKEKENEELCKKIEELNKELNEYNSLDTTRFNITDLRLSRSGSIIENMNEPDNMKYFSSLLCTCQGILYKNKSIEVGYCVKLNLNIAYVLIYIGNCMQKPIDYLETLIFSPDIPIDISETIETHPVPPLSQSNRKLTIHFEHFFSTPPKLRINYNSSSKLLQLPITSVLFLTPSTNEIEVQLKQNEDFLSESLISQIPFSKLQKLLLFAPSFKSTLLEPDFYLYCKEVIIKLSQNMSNTEILIMSGNKELLGIVCELCKTQINFNESVYI